MTTDPSPPDLGIEVSEEIGVDEKISYHIRKRRYNDHREPNQL